MPDLDDWTTRQIDGAFMQALHKAIEETVTGNGTGEMLGFLPREQREPTPVERALAILDAELRRCPLYKAGPPVLYPNWKARP
ncbi:hypothetical protein [Streptomyces mirabilis]|uniref:hypothetical protein n=1 Tax=Streptomyces mirabilis TaxID=68239 RepID=UPI00340CB063